MSELWPSLGCGMCAKHAGHYTEGHYTEGYYTEGYYTELTLY